MMLSVLNVKKSISSILDDRYIQNGLSTGQCFSINTKILQLAFSRRNMEGSNSTLYEKMNNTNYANALYDTFWLSFQIFRGQKMMFSFPLYAPEVSNNIEKVNVAICSHFFLD